MFPTKTMRVSRLIITRHFLLPAVALIVFGLPPIAYADPPADAPAIHFDAQSSPEVQALSAGVSQHDLGALSQLTSSPLMQTFTLRNATGLPLTVDHLQPSCGCISATMDADVARTGDRASAPSSVRVASGQTLPVRVVLDPAGLDPGPLRKTVWVFVKGQDAPAATLVMSATISHFCSFGPEWNQAGPETGRVRHLPEAT